MGKNTIFFAISIEVNSQKFIDAKIVGFTVIKHTSKF